LGDSLSEIITRCLRSCDYGIVVLSPDFFSKKWPANELAGLFAQETKQRKVILPILHNVTVEDVQKCNPILADRKAIPSTKPLEEIVFEIESATGVSRGVKELESRFQPLVAKIRNEILERNANEELSSSIEGRRLIEASVYDVYDRFERFINEIQPSLEIEICYLHEIGTPPTQSNVPVVVTLPPPTPRPPRHHCYSVRASGPSQSYVEIGYDTGEVLRRHRNLHIVVFTLDPNHPSVKEAYKEREFFTYTPIFTANREVMWIMEGGTSKVRCTTEQVAKQAADSLLNFIKERVWKLDTRESYLPPETPDGLTVPLHPKGSSVIGDLSKDHGVPKVRQVPKGPKVPQGLKLRTRPPNENMRD
jgi:hypothetical protein